MLRGAGGHFCAGGDLKDMAAARMKRAGAEGADAIAEVNAQFGAAVRRLFAARRWRSSPCSKAR